MGRRSITATLLSSLLLPLAAGAPLGAAQDAPAPVDRAALERAFAEKMSGAVLVGAFTDDSAPPDAPPAKDRYTIAKAEKLEGDRWRFEAQVEYGGKQFPVAVELDVLWAGDTPVMAMTERRIPLVGTFDVRLLVHGDQYAGTWRGSGHGGHMWGRIERAAVEGEAPAGGNPPGGEAAGGTPPAGEAPAAGKGEAARAGWPGFHGPGASGVAHVTGTPDAFDLASGKHVAWRVEIPGLCHSSPVVLGDRVWLTTAVKEGEPAELKVGLYGSTTPVEDDSVHEYHVLCLDARTGRVLWDTLAWKGVPAVARHPKGSHIAATPATDGRLVVCNFGSEGLFAFDAASGEQRWMVDLGPLVGGWFYNRDPWGYSSSPTIFEERVIVQCDVLDRAFLAAFRLADGKELWRAERDEVPGWGSPTVDVRPGRRQVVVNGYKHMGGYDLDSGRELWRIGGGGDIPVPTPIVAHDLVYITNAHGMMAPIYAIDAMAEGTIDRKHASMVWHTTKNGNYMQTPLVLGERLYLCNDAGILTCRDARSGEEVYKGRLGEGTTGFTASIVATDDRIYATSEEGDVFAVRAGDSFEVVGRSSLGEEAMATPAISDGTIYWRTRGHLVAVR